MQIFTKVNNTPLTLCIDRSRVTIKGSGNQIAENIEDYTTVIEDYNTEWYTCYRASCYSKEEDIILNIKLQFEHYKR